MKASLILIFLMAGLWPIGSLAQTQHDEQPVISQDSEGQSGPDQEVDERGLPSPGQRVNSRPPSRAPFDIQKILVAGRPTPAAAPGPQPEIPPASPPRPLTDQEYQAAAAHVRAATGRDTVSQRALVQLKQMYLASPLITPRTPYVGWGHVSFSYGSSHPEYNPPSATTRRRSSYSDDPEPFHLILRSLVLNSLYMLDLGVGGGRWELHGLYSAKEVYPQNGHIIIGFVPSSDTASLTLHTVRTTYALFYSAKLIKVE